MNTLNDDNRQAKEINLKEIMLVIKRRLLIVILMTVAGTAAGAIYNSINKPVPLYQSSARIVIDTNADSRATLQVIIKDSIILKKVIDKLGLTEQPEDLAQQITVTSIENSQVVNIAVIDTNPKLAADIANTTAAVFKDEIVHILNFKGVTLLSSAEEKPFPINGSSNKLIIIGFIAGLAAGIGLVFLLDSLDDTIRSVEQAEKLFEVPVLGRVNKIKQKKEKKKNTMDLIMRGDSFGSK
ncbi:YveK family protein [Peribacillus kribbensis]|uniref:YveK family protein n=1 Tax=Peribacillus kribbensis TaxID=356658 RepID=UPI0004011069|nr:Wzz/FepE/Etk N-terminal domain-containing protein [Peribacillus kribbensis]